MGRVARYKRIKAFDPGAKRRPAVPEKGPPKNLAPKNDPDVIPHKLAELMRMQAAAKQANQVATRSQAPPAQPPPPAPHDFYKSVTPFPGESQKSFERRVDAHLRRRKAELRAAGPAKHPVSAGRKEKMKERARQRKARKHGKPVASGEGDGDEAEEEGDDGGEEGDGDEAEAGATAGQKRPRAAAASARPRTDAFPTDRVAFGERAMAPPTLAVIPRAKHTREEAARRAAIARPAQASADDGEDSGGGTEGPDAATVAARREELRRAHFAQYKAQVLTAYAEMKKRRVSGGHSGGGVSTGALVAPRVSEVVHAGSKL